MKKRIIIHFNESILLLGESRKVPHGYSLSEQSLVKTAELMLLAPPGLHVYYRTSSLQRSWKRFRRMFAVIKAAGGLAINPEGRHLFIFRRGKWDLPKGKLEKGEGSRAGAVREVEEECLVSGLKITGRLPDTYHVYVQKGKAVLKETHWYSMTCKRWKGAKPQKAEDITQVRWMKKKQVRAAMKNSFASIRTLVRETMPGI